MVCIYVQHAMQNYHQEDTILYQHGSSTEMRAYGEEHYQEGIALVTALNIPCSQTMIVCMQ